MKKLVAMLVAVGPFGFGSVAFARLLPPFPSQVPRSWLAIVSAGVLWASAAGAQDPSTHWLSLINTTQREPADVRVVVVPPVYFSQQAFLGGNLIDTSDLVMSLPGVRAAMEAIDYWEWMLHDGPFAPARLQGLRFPARVLGADATVDDLAAANIVVLTGMATDPLPFVFHLGLGLPTLPPDVLLGEGPGAAPQDVCTVINSGIGANPEDREPARLRNLVIHEFGHCLGAGHTGTSLGADHTSRDGTVYESHPTDVMSVVFGDSRQCLSNLNVQSVAEGYAFLPGNWAPHDSETFLPKTDDDTACMPAALERF
jgi:hypothetical protein